jgi:hypothetical protein
MEGLQEVGHRGEALNPEQLLSLRVLINLSATPPSGSRT